MAKPRLHCSVQAGVRKSPPGNSFIATLFRNSRPFTSKNIVLQESKTRHSVVLIAISHTSFVRPRYRFSPRKRREVSSEFAGSMNDSCQPAARNLDIICSVST